MLKILERTPADNSEREPRVGFKDFFKQLRWHIDSGLHAEFWTITPAMATELMKRNEDADYKNRSASDSQITRYVRAMAEGRWKLTGEPIILSNDGVLLNGQHRLLASIKSGVAFQTLVVFGIEREAFAFMDRGMKRTAANVFEIEGIPNANQMAAATLWVYKIQNHNGFRLGANQTIENEQILKKYYEYEDLQKSIWVSNLIKHEGESLVSPSMMVALHYLMAKKSRSDADDFMRKVITGIGLSSHKEPERRIRKWLIDDNRKNLGRTDNTFRAVFVVLAWNARRTGKSLTAFRWRTEQSPNAPFPTIR